MGKIKVYYFNDYDIDTDTVRKSRSMLTEEALKANLGENYTEQIIWESVKEIDQAELDEFGRYAPN